MVYRETATTEEGTAMMERAGRRGHPTEGAFMKCGRGLAVHPLAYDGHGGFHMVHT
jgi:hypothetical protein